MVLTWITKNLHSSRSIYELLSDPKVREWHEQFRAGGEIAFQATMDVINRFSQGNVPEVVLDRGFQKTIWDDVIDTAEVFNEPGRFSAIIGYEWTSTEDGNNLHRNVLYRDEGDVARQMVPYTTAESFNPEDLWKWMERFEEKTGGQVLALAHNGNMSNGIMFPVEVNPSTGKKLGADYMKQRIRGSRSMRSLRSKVMVRLIPFFLRTTSLRILRPWRLAT